jgi:hypothetical protein
MKNLLVLVLIVAVTLTFGVAAYAARQAIYGFSIDVPAGWSTNVDEGEYSVSFSAPNGSESLKIKHASREGIDASSFAQSVAFELNGNSPVGIGEGEFEFVLPDGAQVRTKHVESWGVVMKSKNGFDRLIEMFNSWTF